jgi:hypothetical protein
MKTLSVVLGLGFLFVSLVHADDRFALAVGARDMLVIFGPKGDRVAELPVPSISQTVTIGSTSFQVSYGRDANELLTAIIAPNPSQPQDLHFNALNKSVDADKQAVVTLTFANDLNHVSVDPGYVGVVQVNSRSMRRHSIADQTPPAPELAPPAPEPRTTAVSPRELPSSAPSARYEPAPLPTPESSWSTAPAPGETSTTAILPPSDTNPSAAYVPPPARRIFWSEPITAPNGTAPSVGLGEMKLVEIKGSVQLMLPGGRTVDGHDGLIVPNGSTVTTSDQSSAAVFLGGVNSVRLLPNTMVKLDQQIVGTVRKTRLDLKTGTVFSRVGRRPGETQDYAVHTAQGDAAARGTDYATVEKADHTYVFVAKGTVVLFMNGKEYKVVLGSSDIGKGSMPGTDDMAEVFNQVMDDLQAFNGKLAQVLADIDSGNGTPQDYAYLHLVIQVSGPEVAGLIASAQVHVNNPNPLPEDYEYINPLGLNPSERRGLNQDFLPFGTQPATPY